MDKRTFDKGNEVRTAVLGQLTDWLPAIESARAVVFASKRKSHAAAAAAANVPQVAVA